MSPLQQVLQTYKDKSKTEREKGTYFEILIKDFLKIDATYSQQFTDVWTWAEYAKLEGIDGNDYGIDLVAKNSDDDGYSAIQCKFYDVDASISKHEINSFIAASGKKQFTRRILIDTTSKGLGDNVEKMLENQAISFTRISIYDLEESSIDWSVYLQKQELHVKPKNSLRPHQKTALERVRDGLANADRGRLIMACGTGKTFTALKLAEDLAGQGKRVLFLVPSLSLMSQTIREWTIHSAVKLHSFAVCSDVQVGKRKNADDLADISTHDLAYPATTDAKKLAEKSNLPLDNEMLVVFSTYQSIEVISKSQKEFNLPEFDLIICDEAHRTTGATLAGEEDSNFVKIHDQDFISGKKRIYMTATPRIFGEAIKTKAKEVNAVIASMDDETKYGKTLYELSFSEAVAIGLLTDYKVLVLAVDEAMVSRSIQTRSYEGGEITLLDDATKIIGCYRALAKLDNKEELINDIKPMKRAVAFCQSIKSSERIKREFASVISEYLTHQPEEERDNLIRCETEHVDGTYNATKREKQLSWLKESADDDVCRILSNARCLSEGVDVPSLDAILFLHPRKSQVDVVQSVGRVMRRAEGKKMGYVILPVGIPAGMSPEDALNKNEKYKVIWQILNALRAHDDRLDSNLNKIDLGVNVDSKIEVIAVSDTLPNRATEKDKSSIGNGGGNSKSDNDNDGSSKPTSQTTQQEFGFEYDTVAQAVYSKIVQKCGTRDYWENWANDISTIANKHILRISTKLERKDSKEYVVFSGFVNELRNNLNEAVTEEEVIEMLAQHIITKPVFNSLFSDYNFADNNSISKSMQSVLDVLYVDNLDNGAESLEKFYNSVKRRANGIDSADAKQKIIIELYDKFFRNAFPRMTERLGIVYTPVECVDFIIHSVNDVLKQEFNQELGDRNTHIVDPFTGTGTFITRLMQSGLLSKEQLEYKYNLQDKIVNGEKIKTTELHANELVLLAYYIASINIEAVYHAIIGGKYQPFEGICLTDTFQLNEKSEDLITPQLADNNHRRKIQKKLPIRVFIGNPPYSAGQSSGNDNNQNMDYPKLNASIENSYVKYSNAGLSKGVYDSYIRAIRWASDRVDKYGVIGFITNAGWIESNSADGMRKCLQDEFSSIYIFHLRGNARTSGELRRKEKDNVFGMGTRTPIAITIMVKNPEAKEHGKIYYHDIGDYLTREQKLEKITELKSLNTITKLKLWQELTPDKHNDWLNQRDDRFYDYISLGDKKDKTSITVFDNFTLGLATNRDAWVYNYSKSKLTQNVSNMIDFYNSELERYKNSDAIKNQPKKLADAEKYVAGFVNNDSTKIGWSVDLRQSFANLETKSTSDNDLMSAIYRPFTKNWCYYKKDIINRTYQMPKVFPENGLENLVIGVTGLGVTKGFTLIISNCIVDLQLLANGQCFPMHLYEPINDGIISTAKTANDVKQDMFSDDEPDDIITAPSGKQYKRKEAITDAGLKHFTNFYGDDSITKEDLFYYIYGLLHSEEYKQKYADNLTKALPRIPRVKTIEDFRTFEKAGRELSKLHLNYETVEMYPVETKDLADLQDADFRVRKMKFAKKDDKSVIIYNDKVRISKIPLEAYDYVVNGKSAIEWVMERQSITKHKESGITNDANDWAIETMNNPRYSYELLCRVITVSIETVKIVNDLPTLDI